MLHYMRPVDSDEPSPKNTCCFLFAFNDAMFFDLSKASVIIVRDLSFQR
jgi:hypothetical protein